MRKFTVYGEFSTTDVEADSPEEAVRKVWPDVTRVDRRLPEVNHADRFWVEARRFSRPIAVAVTVSDVTR